MSCMHDVSAHTPPWQEDESDLHGTLMIGPPPSEPPPDWAVVGVSDTTAALPAGLSVEMEMFDAIDINADGIVSRAELIRALKRDEVLAARLGLSSNIRQVGGQTLLGHN